jgi:subtilase family serine protease
MKKCFLSSSFIFCLFILLLLSARVVGQTSSVRSLITEPVDASQLSVLKGNTHPLARSEFDRGAPPDSVAMDGMQLVLKRSPSQQVALETLLAQQQQQSSPNYHKWLTPDQFSQQFGPSDQDDQTITAWLESQGFHIDDVSKGRTIIEFSGTAGQVRQAFHTVIHKYVLTNGAQHWGNSTDPEIPAALTPAVAGVNTLHNFPKTPLNHVLGVMRRSKETGALRALNPQFTFAGGCNAASSNSTTATVTGTSGTGLLHRL